jgi:fructose-1,6-bisphosphatase I
MPADHLPGTTASLQSGLTRWAGGDPARTPLIDVLRAIAAAGARLSTVVAVNPLKGTLAPEQPTVPTPPTTRNGSTPEPAANPSGDRPTALDTFAEKLYVDALAGLDVAAVCSEETADPIPVTSGGGLVVALDPVDGSSNIDANGSIGTIFSVLPLPAPDADPSEALLQPGRAQLAAGMIVFGPATMLALTVGEGTDLYVLDPRWRDFRLVQQGMNLPTESNEYAINASNARHWGPGIAAYIGDLVSGSLGPRERDFNMRWLASLVGEAYRILSRGGIFLYPADSRPGYVHGRIRLVYEANPIAFLCEQAGGAATDGIEPILDLGPKDLHQRTPLVFGSRSKVDRVRVYLTNPHLPHERSPLFSRRGLFHA